jgi:putative ABC transport system permease protein
MTLEPLGRGSRLLALRGLGADVRWAAGLFLVVAVSTAAVAALPPLYADAQDDALREEAARSSARERDLEVVQAARLPAARLPDTSAERLRTVPAELAGLVDDRTLLVETPLYTLYSVGDSPTPAGTARFLTLRAHEGLDEHSRLVEGRRPAATTTEGRLEVALTAATAAALSVKVGDRLRIEPLLRQPQFQSLNFDLLPAADLVVAGIVAAQTADPYWFGDVRSLRPRIEETETQRLVFASGLIPLTAYPDLLDETGEVMPLTYRWRYGVAARRLDAGALDGLEAAARSVELRYGAVAEAGSPVPEARTGIGRIFERFREQQRVASASLSFAGAGFLGLALVVIVAAALAGGAAQRRALTLARDRGGAVGGAAALTALALVVPATLVGLVLATTLTQQFDAAGIALGLALAGGAALAIATVVAPRAPKPQDAVAAREQRELRDRRRAALEATLVTVAIAGAVALRTRTTSPEGFDALAAATPVLVVLAVGALALRLLPPVARLVGNRLRRRVDLAPTLALRRIERQGALGAPPLVVPLVAAAVATFASLTIGGAGDATAPLLETVGDTLAAISYLSVAYAAAAIVVVVVVLVRERSEEDGRLAALGLRRRPALTLGLAQFVPPIAAGAVAGSLAAGLAFAAVRPAFEAADAVALGAPLAVALALFALPVAGAAAVVVSHRRAS